MTRATFEPFSITTIVCPRCFFLFTFVFHLISMSLTPFVGSCVPLLPQGVICTLIVPLFVPPCTAFPPPTMHTQLCARLLRLQDLRSVTATTVQAVHAFSVPPPEPTAEPALPCHVTQRRERSVQHSREGRAGQYRWNIAMVQYKSMTRPQ